ncbi:hypothetical protein SAY86_031793 [Trapa natans]|uniref:LYK3/4/5 second LysM domain-containing protein n=1 Tax=Trapa natans TaxID=22666 RepID=A0AAN7M853_TRANT|nr:hypothetical protein SAY86_031793 [Trapa natans]
MNSSYIIGQGDTYNSTADVIYQWLTSCQALIDQKGYNAYEDLRVGDTMPVPIRCACPTREQIHQSMAYLLTNAAIPEKRTISMSRANTRLLLAPGESPSPDFGAGESPSPDLGAGESPAPDFGAGESPSPDFGPGEPPSPDLGAGEPLSSDLGRGEPPRIWEEAVVAKILQLMHP